MEAAVGTSSQSAVGEAGAPEFVVAGTDSSPPSPSPPADSRSASADPSRRSEAKEMSVVVPAVHSETLDEPSAASSEALLPAQSQQSIQADESEILAPSQSMALLHSQSQGRTAEAASSDLQSDEAASAVQSEEPLAEAANADATGNAEASLTDAADVRSADSAAAGQQVAKDAPTVSGQQQEDTAAPFAHATFVVPTENWKHMQMVPLLTTAAEIKHSLCSNWNIAESALSVKYQKQEIQDGQSLASCGIQARPAALLFLIVVSPMRCGHFMHPTSSA